MNLIEIPLRASGSGQIPVPILTACALLDSIILGYQSATYDFCAVLVHVALRIQRDKKNSETHSRSIFAFAKPWNVYCAEFAMTHVRMPRRRIVFSVEFVFFLPSHQFISFVWEV